MVHWNVDAVRRQFPALQRQVNGGPAVFFDGPAGSQTPQRVIDAVGRYMAGCNANHGGQFATSRESDELLDQAHAAVAEFVGAGDPDEIVFGANMTSLTFALSRALARTWKPGDEIIVTRSEHDANFTPWVLAARGAGAIVRQVDMHPRDATLDLDDLRRQLSSRTRLLAVGCASNASGTIHPVAEMAALAHAAGAEVFVDAVHYAPHLPLDVAAWDCDYLACSAYKFFGPHVGVLWGRRQRLATLPVDKLRPAPDDLPGRWMTGTQNHEGIAGTLAAVEYLADLGRSLVPAVPSRRLALLAAYAGIAEYERELSARMLAGLSEIPGLRLYGIRDSLRLQERVPTFCFRLGDCPSHEVARQLGERGIFVWHGNYYAVPFMERMELEPHGAVRAGMLHYNTAEEVDRLLAALHALAAR